MKSRFTAALVASMMAAGSPAMAQVLTPEIPSPNEILNPNGRSEITCREEFDERADAEEIDNAFRSAAEIICLLRVQQQQVNRPIIEYQKLCVVGDDNPKCNPRILDGHDPKITS